MNARRIAIALLSTTFMLGSAAVGYAQGGGNSTRAGSSAMPNETSATQSPGYSGAPETTGSIRGGTSDQGSGNSASDAARAAGSNPQNCSDTGTGPMPNTNPCPVK